MTPTSVVFLARLEKDRKKKGRFLRVMSLPWLFPTFQFELVDEQVEFDAERWNCSATNENCFDHRPKREREEEKEKEEHWPFLFVPISGERMRTSTDDRTGFFSTGSM